MSDAATLARVIRSGLVESVHLGHAAVCDGAGELVARAGDPDHLVFARSAMKPLQAAVSLLLVGEELLNDEVAVMAGSHHAERVHVEAVQRLLGRAGLDAAALRCPSAWPRHPEDVRSAPGPSPLFHNCSGKHAGMLLASARRGFPLETYTEPDHPLQQAVLEAVLRTSGLKRVDTGVDGCGVPVHGMPLSRMATLFAGLARPAPEDPLADAIARVTQGMRAEPYLVAWKDHVDTTVMQVVDGVVVKSGAEGLICAGLFATGWGIAVKVADGNARAAGPALLRALHLLEVVGTEQVAALERFARPPVLGGGRPVGALTSDFEFAER